MMCILIVAGGIVYLHIVARRKKCFHQLSEFISIRGKILSQQNSHKVAEIIATIVEVYI